MITCKQLIEFTAAYVEGELDEASSQAFEQHLARCRSCQAYLRSYRQTMRMARELATEDPAEDVPEELVQAILAQARR